MEWGVKIKEDKKKQKEKIRIVRKNGGLGNHRTNAVKKEKQHLINFCSIISHTIYIFQICFLL